jgi:acetamidase/formamidase
MRPLTAGSHPTSATHHLTSTPDTVTWGTLPTPDTPAVLEVHDGDTVTFDTVSSEGLMEDQGRDPVAWFSQYGVPRSQVLDEAVELAASGLHRGPDAGPGPHIVLGPVQVRGAEVGDWLRVDFLALEPRVPYGLISSRHQRGCLPGEFPRPRDGRPVGLFTRFCSLDERGDRALFDHAGGRSSIGLAPFMGLCGVTPDSPTPLSTIPPGPFGGNIDLRELVSGTSLFLRVQVPGAGFHLGDPHFAQGNGEIALTALEGSLRATVRLSVVAPSLARNSLDQGFLRDAELPFAETDTHWVVLGLHEDLAEAMRRCARTAVAFVAAHTGMAEDEAYLFLSAAGDFSVTQVVDQVTGVHCAIRKNDL